MVIATVARAITCFVGLVVFTGQSVVVPSNQTMTTGRTATRPAVPSQSNVQATIHFVGLVAFTTRPVAVPSNPIYTTARTTARPAAPSQSNVVAIFPRVDPPIEPHTALIAFQSCDYLGSTGWNPIELRRGDGLLYVPLNGEHITFQTGAADHPIDAPTGLPHLKASWQSKPSVSTKQYDLQLGYKPPDYSLAKGVVEFSVGTLRACSAVTAGTNSRVDTQVTLNTNGALVITAGSKTLKVKGDSVVTFANVPLTFAQHEPDAAHPYQNVSEHYRAYCKMADKTVEVCGVPAFSNTATQIQPCSLSTANMRGTAPAAWPETLFRAVGFECSNSQWP